MTADTPTPQTSETTTDQGKTPTRARTTPKRARKARPTIAELQAALAARDQEIQALQAERDAAELVTFSARVPRVLRDRVAVLARRQGMTMQDVGRDALTAWCERQDQDGDAD